MKQILMGSCRAHGNCAYAANLIASTREQNFQESIQISSIARQDIKACIACGHCETHHGKCSLSLKQADPAHILWNDIFLADHTIFIVPIYFYHVPALVKALLDRAQAWYCLPKEERPAYGKSVGLILLGARPQGQKLFEGAQLSFKYALDAVGMSLHSSLLLYGLDARDDLSKHTEYKNSILDFASEFYNRAL